MEIVILDGYTENPGDLSWDKFKEFGTLRVYDRTSYTDEDIIRERIGNAEIINTNKTPITRRTVDECPSIKAILVLATGYNVIDTEYAAQKGIPVMNVPSYGTEIVGQYAVALLLELCSHIGHHSQTVREGKWESSKDFCYWEHPMIELYGKTAGIIGLGRIGRTTARILKAIGMDVLAAGSHECPEGRELAEYVDLDHLLSVSDVIFLHCPLNEKTREIINKDTIAKMKDGVMIINNSRGPLIDEKALAKALKEGKVKAAALDVVSVEPIRGDNPLLCAPNCIITPHISWAAKESRERIMETTYQNLKSFIAGDPQNTVNRINMYREI